MCQRSNSSAKEVHRGRQQKRISRQPLQSSSSRTAAAAAAVAAAGAETSNEEQFHYRQGALAEKHLNDPCRGFTGGIGHLQWVLGVGVRGWRDRDEDMGGWNRRSRCKILHFVVWDVEGQDEIWRMRRQDYRRIDGLVRVADRNDRSRTRRTMRACWFPAVEQELFDAVAAAEITEKLGLHNSRHRQWFSRSACAKADDGFFLESLDQISRTLSSWN